MRMIFAERSYFFHWFFITFVLLTIATCLPPEVGRKGIDPPTTESNYAEIQIPQTQYQSQDEEQDEQVEQTQEQEQEQEEDLNLFSSSKETKCNPEVDFSLDCQFRAAECRIVSYILHGIDGGLMSNLLYCSTVLNVVLDTSKLFNSSNVDNSSVSTLELIDHCISSDADKTRVRRCVLQGSHLIQPNGKLDRSSIAKRFETHLFWTPLSTALSKAVFICPEPLLFDMRPFFHCLRDVCIENAPRLVEMYIPTDPSTGMMILDLYGASMPTSPPFLAGGLIY